MTYNEENIFRDFGEYTKYYEFEKLFPKNREDRLKEGLRFISPNVLVGRTFRRRCIYDGVPLDTERLGRVDDSNKVESYFSCPKCNLVYILPIGLESKSSDSGKIVDGLLKELFEKD